MSSVTMPKCKESHHIGFSPLLSSSGVNNIHNYNKVEKRIHKIKDDIYNCLQNGILKTDNNFDRSINRTYGYFDEQCHINNCYKRDYDDDKEEEYNEYDEDSSNSGDLDGMESDHEAVSSDDYNNNDNSEEEVVNTNTAHAAEVTIEENEHAENSPKEQNNSKSWRKRRDECLLLRHVKYLPKPYVESVQLHDLPVLEELVHKLLKMGSPECAKEKVAIHLANSNCTSYTDKNNICCETCEYSSAKCSFVRIGELPFGCPVEPHENTSWTWPEVMNELSCRCFQLYEFITSSRGPGLLPYHIPRRLRRLVVPFLYKWLTCWEVIIHSPQNWLNISKCWRLHATRPRYNYKFSHVEINEEESESETETREDESNNNCNNAVQEIVKEEENVDELQIEETENEGNKKEEVNSEDQFRSSDSSNISSTNTTASIVNTNYSNSGSNSDDESNISWASNDFSVYSSRSNDINKSKNRKTNYNNVQEIQLSYKPLLDLIVNLFNNDAYQNKFISLLEWVQSEVRQELRRSAIAASYYFVSGATNYYVNYTQLLIGLWDWAAPLLSERQMNFSVNTLVILNTLLPACVFNPPWLQKKNKHSNQRHHLDFNDNKCKDESQKCEKYKKAKKRAKDIERNEKLHTPQRCESNHHFDVHTTNTSKDENEDKEKVESSKKELRAIVHKIVFFVLLEGLTWSGSSSQWQDSLNWQSSCFQLLAKFINPNCYGLVEDMGYYAEPLFAAVESYLQLKSLRSMQMDNLHETQKRTAEDREMEMQQERRVCDVNAAWVFNNEYSTRPQTRFHFISLNRNATARLVASIVLCSLPSQTNSPMWNHLRRFIHAMNDIPLQNMSKTRKSISNSGNILIHIIKKYGLSPSSSKMCHDAVACRSSSSSSNNSNGEAQRIITFYTNLIECFYVHMMKARRRAKLNEIDKNAELCSYELNNNNEEYLWNDNNINVISEVFVEVMREPLHTMELVKAEEFCVCLRWLLLLSLPFEQNILPRSIECDTINTNNMNGNPDTILYKKEKSKETEEVISNGRMTLSLMNEFVMPQLAHLVKHLTFTLNNTTNDEKDNNNTHKESPREIILSANDRAIVLLLLISCAPLLLESPTTHKTFRAFFMKYILPMITGVDWMNNSNAWTFNYCIMYVVFVTHTALQVAIPITNPKENVMVKQKQQQEIYCNVSSSNTNATNDVNSSPVGITATNCDGFDFTCKNNEQKQVYVTWKNSNGMELMEMKELQETEEQEQLELEAQQNEYKEFMYSFFERCLELLRHKSGTNESNEMELYVSSAVMLGEVFYNIDSDKIAWQIAELVMHSLHHMSFTPNRFDLYLLTALTKRFLVIATQYVNYTLSLLVPCAKINRDTSCVMKKSLCINSPEYLEEEEEEYEQLRNYENTNVKLEKELEEENSSKYNKQDNKTHSYRSRLLEEIVDSEEQEQKERSNQTDMRDKHKFNFFSFAITDAKELHHSCLLLSVLLPSLRLSTLYALRARVTSCIYMLCRHMEHKENVESAILLYKSFYVSLLHQLHMESCTFTLQNDNTTTNQKTLNYSNNNSSSEIQYEQEQHSEEYTHEKNVKRVNDHTYEMTRAESQYTSSDRSKRYRECDFKIKFNNVVYINEKFTKHKVNKQNDYICNKSNSYTNTTCNVMQEEHVIDSSSEHINQMTEEVHIFLNTLFTALLTDLIDLLHTFYIHSSHSNKRESRKKTSFSALQSLCEKQCTQTSESLCEEEQLEKEIKAVNEECNNERDNTDKDSNYKFCDTKASKFTVHGIVNTIYGQLDCFDSATENECMVDDNVMTNMMQLLCSILVISRDQFHGLEQDELENAEERFSPHGDNSSNNNSIRETNESSITHSDIKCTKTHSLTLASCPWYLSTERYCYNSFAAYRNANSQITLPFSREHLFNIIFTEALPLLLDYNQLLETTTHDLHIMDKFINTNGVFGISATQSVNEETFLQSRNVEMSPFDMNSVSNYKSSTSRSVNHDSPIEKHWEKEEWKKAASHERVHKCRSTEREINIHGLEWAVEALEFLASPMREVDLTRRQEYFVVRKNVNSSPSSTISALFDNDSHINVYHLYHHHHHHQQYNKDKKNTKEGHCKSGNTKKVNDEENNNKYNNNDNINVNSQSFQSLIWFAHNLLDDNSTARPFRYHANRLYYLNETYAERRGTLEKYRRYPLRFWNNKLCALWQRCLFTMHNVSLSSLRPLSTHVQGKLMNLAMMLLPTYLATIYHSKQINTSTSGYSHAMRFIQRNTAFLHMLLTHVFESMCVENLDSELQLVLLNSLTQIVLSKLSYVENSVSREKITRIDDAKDDDDDKRDNNIDDNDDTATSHLDSVSSSQSRAMKSETTTEIADEHFDLQEKEHKESMTRAQLNFIRCSVKCELFMIKELLVNISLITQGQYAPHLPICNNCYVNNSIWYSTNSNEQINNTIMNETNAERSTRMKTSNKEYTCYAINVMQSVITMIRTWPEELHDETTKELLYVALPQAMITLLSALPIHLIEVKVKWLHCFVELAYDCYKSTPTLATSWLSLAMEAVDEICAQVSLKESLYSSCINSHFCEKSEEEEEHEQWKKMQEYHGEMQQSAKEETFLPLSVKVYKQLFKMTLEPNIGIQQIALRLTSKLMCATRPSMNCTPSSVHNFLTSHVDSELESRLHRLMNHSTGTNTEQYRLLRLRLRKKALLEECFTSDHAVNETREEELRHEQHEKEKKAHGEKKKKKKESQTVSKDVMPCRWWEELRCVRYAHLHTLLNTIQNKLPLHVDRIQRAGDVFLPKYLVLYGNNSFCTQLNELLDEYNNSNKCNNYNTKQNDATTTTTSNNNEENDKHNWQSDSNYFEETAVSLMNASDAEDAITMHRLKEENIFSLVTQERYEQRMKESDEHTIDNNKNKLQIQECEEYENSLDVEQQECTSSQNASTTQCLQSEEQHNTQEVNISNNNNIDNIDCSAAIDELTMFVWQGASDKNVANSSFTSFDWISKFIISHREFIKTTLFPPENEVKTDVTYTDNEVQLMGTRWWMYLSNVIWPQVYFELLHNLITMWLEQVESNSNVFDKIEGQQQEHEDNNTRLLETSCSVKEDEIINSATKTILQSAANVDEENDIRNEERFALVLEMIMGYVQSPLLNLPSTLLASRHQERLQLCYKPLLIQCLNNKVQYKASSVVMMWERFGITRLYYSFNKFDMVCLMREICKEVDLYLHLEPSSSSSSSSSDWLERITPSQTELSTLVRLLQLLSQVLNTFAHELANDKQLIQEWVNILMKWEDILFVYSFYSVRISSLTIKLISKTLSLTTSKTLIYNANTQDNTTINNDSNCNTTTWSSDNNNYLGKSEEENKNVVEHLRKLEKGGNANSALNVLITFGLHLHERWVNAMNELMSLLAKEQSHDQQQHEMKMQQNHEGSEILNNEYTDNVVVVVGVNLVDRLDEFTDKSKKTTIKTNEDMIGRYVCELRILILLWSSIPSPILFRCFRERFLNQLVKAAHIMSLYELESTSELTIVITSTILTLSEVIKTKEDVHWLLTYITSLFVNETMVNTETQSNQADLHTLHDDNKQSVNNIMANDNTVHERIDIKNIPCGLQAIFIHLLRWVVATHYHKIGKFAHMELLWRTARAAFANYFDHHAHGIQRINAHRANAYKLKVQALALVITLTRVASSSQINVLVQRELKELALHTLDSEINNTNTSIAHVANFHVLCSVIASDTCGSIPSFLPKLMERLIKEVQHNHIRGVQEREQRRSAMHTTPEPTEEINVQSSPSISASTLWLEEKSTLTEILTRWWNRFHRNEWENEYHRYFTPAQAELLLLFVRGHCNYYA